MKRRLCAWLAALLLLHALSGALAEPEYDFSHMTLDELYAMRDQLNAWIAGLEHLGGQRVYESGTYLVGQDMPEGDYVLVERADAIFAGVVVREDNSIDSNLITYKLVNRQAVIHLHEETWVTLTDAAAYPVKDAPQIGLEDAASHEGSYLVGLMIPAGRYVASVLDKAPLSSYSVYDGILGTDASLTKFEMLHGDAELELAEGDYIELSGCVIRPAE